MDLNTKMYIITTAKEIPCLGGITGPITTPVKLELSELIWLLNNGYIITSPEEDLVNDLVNIVDIFSCRISGLRKYKSKIKKVLDND